MRSQYNDSIFSSEDNRNINRGNKVQGIVDDLEGNVIAEKIREGSEKVRTKQKMEHSLGCE